MNTDQEKTKELIHQLARALETTREEETERTILLQNKINTQEDLTYALKEKINNLEKQLQQYLEHAPEKEKRARELQYKINEQTLNKQQQKAYLKQRLAQLKNKMQEERKKK